MPIIVLLYEICVCMRMKWQYSEWNELRFSEFNKILMHGSQPFIGYITALMNKSTFAGMLLPTT